MFSLTYCEYNGKHYMLDSGPIGLGTTGEIAKIYMEDFQIRTMNTSPCPLDQWSWYVDDSELKCKKEDSEKILEHLNGMEKGVIQFTNCKEEQKEDILPVLDLKQRVDRKAKPVKCMVHHKKTHTNITVKEKSNHPPYMKKGIIKAFADRARVLCDDQHLGNELKNIEDVFVANGYEREVRKYMETERNERKELVEENENYRGVVSIPYVQGLSEQVKRVARKRNFRTAFRRGRKVRRDIKSQQPLRDKRKAVVYKIPCKCNKAVYVGETWRLFGTQRKEQESKVRLTGEDIRNGRLDAAREWMGKEDGGLARHSVDCGSGIDWGEARVVACEYGLQQRKAREGVESLRERSNGNVVLNNYEPLTAWRPTLDRYLDSESKNACMSTLV